MRPLFERDPRGGNRWNVPRDAVEKILDAAAREGEPVREFLAVNPDPIVVETAAGIILKKRTHGKTDRY